MNDSDLGLLVRYLFVLSRQISSCEHKLNKLLEKAGEDVQLLHLSENLHHSSDALQAAMQQEQPTKKET